MTQENRNKSHFAVETRDLTKKFGTFIAVDTLNLNVNKGEIYGLLGPNGAGKTTTIKMLCGVLNPTSGGAHVLGRKIPEKSITPLIGYMPQERALYLWLTVHQNVEFYGDIFGMEREKFNKSEKELLSFIDLEEWRNELVVNLSGGMMHRVSLACSLIHKPDLLFLDEPTIGIDPELRASFWKYFNELKQKGITILMTTHYMDEAIHCDRIGFMRRAHLIAEGTPDELLKMTKTDSLENAFLKFSRGEVKL